MKSEFKRAMKLMWGHSWRVRMSCGCSILFLCVCLFLLFWGESSFFEFRRHRHVFDGQGSFSIGTRGSMLFFFFSLYGNGRLLLYGFGKWLRSSKVAKSMLVDCLIVNRLLVFGVMFLPCLVSRICLIGMGYGEYARIALFLVVWGITYVLSALCHLSEWTYPIGLIIYMASMGEGFWSFASGLRISTIGAVAVFLLCVIGGTLSEKLILERGYRSRKGLSKSFWYKNVGGNKRNGE